MRQVLVAGNWKMHGLVEPSEQLLGDLRLAIPPDLRAEVVVFPPAIYIGMAKALLNQSPISWGAQNCYPGEKGAFTGEVSARMLAELGCRYVLVGHSERRVLFGETDSLLVEKVRSATQFGIMPIYCVGEDEAQYRAGESQSVVASQLSALCADDQAAHLLGDLVIAYEPVWAIGTGLSATAEHVQMMHASIRDCIQKVDSAIAQRTRILYGGSVKSDNVSELVSQCDVDGVLVGGASLKAAEFLKIIEQCNHYS